MKLSSSEIEQLGIKKLDHLAVAVQLKDQVKKDAEECVEEEDGGCAQEKDGKRPEAELRTHMGSSMSFPCPGVLGESQYYFQYHYSTARLLTSGAPTTEERLWGSNGETGPMIPRVFLSDKRGISS